MNRTITGVPQTKSMLRFLGTAGARHAVSQQLRASGGLWLHYRNTQIMIDPGPGALVRSRSFRPDLHPGELDGIVLTHRHLDHSCDLNVMVEAMTQGGNNPRGQVFLPADALDREPVLFSYARDYLHSLQCLREGGSYRVGEIEFATPLRHRHPVETYGLKIRLGRRTLALIADTGFWDELLSSYSAEVLIINTLALEHNPRTADIHLSLQEAARLIAAIRPQLALLTHFGTRIIHAGPARMAETVQEQTGIRVVAAEDQMSVDLNSLQIWMPTSRQK